MAAKKEIRSLSGLRGVAALYVILLHYFSDIPFSNPVFSFIRHGYLAVDLFFVLSGFVMALNYSHMFSERFSPRAYLTFLGRRIARIYPLYLVTTLAALGLVMAGWLYERPPHVYGILALNLAMVQVWGLAPSLDGPGWSISAEWAAYLVFPLLLVPTLGRRRVLAVLTACVSVVVLVLLTHAKHDDPKALLEVYSQDYALPVMLCIAEFSLGLLAYRVAALPMGRALSERRWVTPLLLLAILALLCVPYTDIVITLLIPLLIVGLAGGADWVNRLLSTRPAVFLGTLSYSLYLTHYLMRVVLLWVHHLADVHHLAHGQTYAAAAGLLLTFPISWAAYRLVELPGRRWLRHVFEGRPTAVVAEQIADHAPIDTNTTAA